MKLNNNLLKGIDKNKRELGKLILFCIHENIRLDTYLTTQSELFRPISLSWKDDILGNVQDIMRFFINEKILVENYSTEKQSRWKLMRPLYVSDISLEILNDEKIKKLRSYFSKKYCGQSRQSTFQSVKEHILIWIEKNPNHDLKIIEPVFKYYIDSKLEKDETGIYVANIINFIDINGNIGKELNLVTAYEEYEEGNRSFREEGIFSD